MGDRSELIVKLKILGELSPGMTISYKSMTLVNHNYWSTSIWRWYNGETGTGTVNFIKDILTSALTLLNSSYDDELLSLINSALIGITALYETYKRYPDIIMSIVTIIADTKKSLEQIDKSRQQLISKSKTPQEQSETQMMPEKSEKPLLPDLEPKEINQVKTSDIEYIKNGDRGKIYICKSYDK